MPGTATAVHAQTLFSLTMESRYGCQWRETIAAEVIARLAEEIAQGFGGASDSASPGLWTFPDTSHARVGAFGLRSERDAAGNLKAA